MYDDFLVLPPDAACAPLRDALLLIAMRVAVVGESHQREIVLRVPRVGQSWFRFGFKCIQNFLESL
jgi:hypothetical protein